MKGRRTAAVLCVLLAHALIIYSLQHLRRPEPRGGWEDSFVSEPITLYLQPPSTEAEPVAAGGEPRSQAPSSDRKPAVAAEQSAAPPAGESAGITTPERIDWPLEGKKSATRVLAREAEAERIAKLFSGPGGTWASLTKREKSRLKKFRWKPGVDGLEFDENGNAIYHISEGCVLVNFMYIGCALGKSAVHGDLFKDMRLYFDEQRLPQTNQGNGTEPESLRPANAPRASEGGRSPFDAPPPPEGH